MMIKQQTTAQKTWRDEEGMDIPVNRLKAIERTKEITAYKLAKKALALNAGLVAFKADMAKTCTVILDAAMDSKERSKMGKGSYSWHNFDGSIKIEMKVNENIDFDSLLIERAKQRLLELVGESISADKSFIKELVLSAFQTSKGKLDTKKILGLKKHAARIKDKRYAEAMSFIDESIRRPDSKTYFRVSVRDENGEYKIIDLNFSSI